MRKPLLYSPARTFDEIAAALGITPQIAAKTCARALVKLRRQQAGLRRIEELLALRDRCRRARVYPNHEGVEA